MSKKMTMTNRLKSALIVLCAVISVAGLSTVAGSQAYADSNGSSVGTWEDDSCPWMYSGKIWTLSTRYTNQSFKPGKFCLSSGYSTDPRAYRATFQKDGNFVIYNMKTSKAIWATGTNNKGVTRMTFQTDGNIVLYVGNRAIWNTGTYNKIKQARADFEMQSDGNLVLYGGSPKGPVYWVSHTWHK